MCQKLYDGFSNVHCCLCANNCYDEHCAFLRLAADVLPAQAKNKFTHKTFCWAEPVLPFHFNSFKPWTVLLLPFCARHNSNRSKYDADFTLID